MNWKLDNARLVVGGISVLTPDDRKVIKVIERGPMLVALLDWKTNPAPADNVIALDSQGRTLWRIKPYPFKDGPNPVTNIWSEGDRMKAGFWIGYDVTIDPQTGAWSDPQWTR